MTWNRACEEIFLYGKEIIGKGYDILMTSKTNVQDFSNLIERVFNRESIKNFEITYQGKDGARHYMISRLYPLYNQEGDVISCVVANTDITQRVQTENVLRQNEKKLNMILSNIDEIIYMVHISGGDPLNSEVQFVSPQVKNIFGYEPEEFLHDPKLWFRLIHPEDIPAVKETTRKIFSTKKPGKREYRIRHKHTGKYHWMEDHLTLQLDETGNVIGQFGVARDITERKRSEKILQQSEMRYRRLFESTREAIVVYSPDKKVISANPAAAYLLGYKQADKLVGQSMTDHFADVEQLNGILHKLFKKGYIENFEAS